VNLQELAAETLVQKHMRLMQAKCRHDEIYSSTVSGPRGISTTCFCLDCGKSWHTKREPASAPLPAE
jgi:hypothetical protein